MQIEWIGVGALLILLIGIGIGRYIWPKVKSSLGK